MTDAERAVFDAVRDSDGPIDRSVGDAPRSRTSDPDAITLYSVVVEDATHPLQEKHLAYEPDIAELLLRVGAGAAGLLLLLAAVYRGSGASGEATSPTTRPETEGGREAAAGPGAGN